MRRIAPLLLIALTLPLAGCGGPKLARVQGKVTVAGKPVRKGRIMFYPAGAPGATGAIAEDGSYSLTTHKPGDGAAVGEHRVAIEATEVGAGSMRPPQTPEEEMEMSRVGVKRVLVAGKVIWLVPEKYSKLETSGLTATVRASDNQIDFDIPAQR